MRVKTSDILAGIVTAILMLILMQMTVDAWDREEDMRENRVRQHIGRMAK